MRNNSTSNPAPPPGVKRKRLFFFLSSTPFRPIYISFRELNPPGVGNHWDKGVGKCYKRDEGNRFFYMYIYIIEISGNCRQLFFFFLFFIFPGYRKVRQGCCQFFFSFFSRWKEVKRNRRGEWYLRRAIVKDWAMVSFSHVLCEVRRSPAGSIRVISNCTKTVGQSLLKCLNSLDRWEPITTSEIVPRIYAMPRRDALVRWLFEQFGRS